MADFAIITTGGKQYKVSAGQKLKVEKLTPKDDVASFDVLLRSVGGTVEIGAPKLATAAQARFVGNGRGEKKIIFKYHAKTRQRKKKPPPGLHRSRNHQDIKVSTGYKIWYCSASLMGRCLFGLVADSECCVPVALGW